MVTRKEAERSGKMSDSPAGTGKVKKPSFDISIFRSWCKDCGICAQFCKQNVFDQDVLGSPLITRPQDCNGCQECVLHCPDFAMEVTRKKTKKEEE